MSNRTLWPTLATALAIGVIGVVILKRPARPIVKAPTVAVATLWVGCGGRSHPEPRIRIEETTGDNPWADHATGEIVIDPNDQRLRGDLRGVVAHEFAHLTAFREQGYGASYDGSPYFERRHYEVRKCLGLEP